MLLLYNTFYSMPFKYLQDVTDSLTYSMNLTLVNEGSSPDFPLAYSAKEAYSLTNMSPQSWAEAAWKMASDDELLYEYYR